MPPRMPTTEDDFERDPAPHADRDFGRAGDDLVPPKHTTPWPYHDARLRRLIARKRTRYYPCRP